MARAEFTRTIALYPSSVYLQWMIETRESGSFLVDVARSGGPAGPWDTIATGLVDSYNFIDNLSMPPAELGDRNGRERPNLYSLSRDMYYQLTVTPPSGPANQFVSRPTPIEPGLSPINRGVKRRLIYDLSVSYRAVNGIPLAVLKRKRWGSRCPECWDPVTKEVTNEHCPVCYATSFVGGYWAPVYIRGRKEAAAVQTRLEAHGEADVKYTDFTILDLPHIEYRDLLIDLDKNDRYEVQRVAPGEINTVIVHQEAACSLLGRNSVEYSVLVDPLRTPPLY